MAKSQKTTGVKKYSLVAIRKSDGREFTRLFKTKKDRERYMNNNYTEYKFIS